MLCGFDPKISKPSCCVDSTPKYLNPHVVWIRPQNIYPTSPCATDENLHLNPELYPTSPCVSDDIEFLRWPCLCLYVRVYVFVRLCVLVFLCLCVHACDCVRVCAWSVLSPLWRSSHIVILVLPAIILVHHVAVCPPSRLHQGCKTAHVAGAHLHPDSLSGCDADRFL